MKVGFTEDGQVFIAGETKSPEGRPMEMYATFTTLEARNLADHLTTAAKKAELQQPPIIVTGASYDRARTH